MTLAVRIAWAAAATAAIQTFKAGTPVDDNANASFDPPTEGLWGRVSFQDGAERRFPGREQQLVRKPVLMFVDLFVPSGEGDGEVVDGIEAVRAALRDMALAGARFDSFQEGPEGKSEGRYRKQLIVVLRLSFRV